MNVGPVAVLDACVLANYSLCDTLLRLAEPPGLFEARWSSDIIAETVRTLTAKLAWKPHIVASFERELTLHFGRAWVSGYESLMPRLANDPKDRHVLAAAIACRADVVVTFNLRDFRSEHLSPFGVRAIHPDRFLLELWADRPDETLNRLRVQASARNRTLSQLAAILATTVPGFSQAALSK